jgi:hypothetical protein
MDGVGGISILTDAGRVGPSSPPFSQREKGLIPLSLWERVRVRAAAR